MSAQMKTMWNKFA